MSTDGLRGRTVARHLNSSGGAPAEPEAEGEERILAQSRKSLRIGSPSRSSAHSAILPAKKDDPSKFAEEQHCEEVGGKLPAKHPWITQTNKPVKVDFGPVIGLDLTLLE